MRRSLGFLLIAACTYAAQLLVTAPATLADAALDRWSAGRLRLAEAAGTVWSGSGQLEFLDARGRTGAAKPIAWRLRAASLLRGRAEVEFTADDAPFTVTFFPSRIEASNVRFSLPAGALGLVVPNFMPIEPTGNVLLDVPRLSIGNEVHGSATLLWSGAGSALAPVSPLGDYQLEVRAQGRSASAVLKTVRGLLSLDGRVSWTLGRAPSLSITARVQSQYREQLQPLLRLIAVDRGDGSFQLKGSIEGN